MKKFAKILLCALSFVFLSLPSFKADKSTERAVTELYQDYKYISAKSIPLYRFQNLAIWREKVCDYIKLILTRQGFKEAGNAFQKLSKLIYSCGAHPYTDYTDFSICIYDEEVIGFFYYGHGFKRLAI